MAALSRSWAGGHHLDGPFRVELNDVNELNQVFSDAFTERYRRDGMVGVRVPFLNPAIWRYAIADADDGAMLWRDGRGEIAAFNIVHRSGSEGWMGPLAVRSEHQGGGIGKDIVRSGIEWLRRAGARVIGLETMPRTMDNIGFYSRLGFVPGRLTLTTTLDPVYDDRPGRNFGRLSSAERGEALARCRTLVEMVAPGYDYTREITLTEELSLGETALLYEADRLVGFALAHTTPLVEGRVREELRVLKLVLDDAQRFPSIVRVIRDLGRRTGSRRVAFRLQGDYLAAYQHLISLGGQVRWSDLRMSLGGYEEKVPRKGMVLSNWEI